MMCRCHTVGVAVADVDGFSTGAVTELGPVGLATIATAKRFVRQDQCFVNDHVCNGQKEPLSLSDERSILAAIACFA